MGFNNAGASAVAARLARMKASGKWPRVPVGINIGKSKITPNEQAASDYATSYKLLLPFGDYFVVNVSSPNTPNLRALQDRDALAEIIRTLRVHMKTKMAVGMIIAIPLPQYPSLNKRTVINTLDSANKNFNA
jgi:dihydroorotate dehydrogenase